MGRGATHRDQPQVAGGLFAVFGIVFIAVFVSPMVLANLGRTANTYATKAQVLQEEETIQYVLFFSFFFGGSVYRCLAAGIRQRTTACERCSEAAYPT